MSYLERAVIRHIARTAFHQAVAQQGKDSALLEARRQASASAGKVNAVKRSTNKTVVKKKR